MTRVKAPLFWERTPRVLHIGTMTASAAPTIDYSNIFLEAAGAREAGRDAVLAPIVQSLQDALILGGVGGLFLLAAAFAVWGLSTRNLDKALLGLIACIPVTMLGIQLLQTTDATLASAGLGILLLLAAVAKGWRGILRLFRLVN